MKPASHISGKGAVAAIVIVGLLIVGSFVYWVAEGQPGTADDFRRRANEAGLNVAWSNSGPRGGSGVVDTACGPVEVTVSDLDDQLWIRWSDKQLPATRRAVDALLTCAP